jgi:hypothetical protein
MIVAAPKARECDDDGDVEGSEVEESGTEEEDCVQESDDEVATDADVEYGHNAENQRPEFVGRSYDDIDSGSDMKVHGPVHGAVEGADAGAADAAGGGVGRGARVGAAGRGRARRHAAGHAARRGRI